jgi:hypothetical protein
MKPKTKIAEIKEKLLLLDLQDDRKFFCNMTDNNENFISKLLNSPHNNRIQILPNDNYELVDGKIACSLGAYKYYILLLSKEFFSNDLQQVVNAETSLKLYSPEQYKSVMSTNSLDSLKVVILHNPEKPAELVTGETLTYEILNETRFVEVWNGTRMTERKVLEKNEYLLIS